MISIFRSLPFYGLTGFGALVSFSRAAKRSLVFSCSAISLSIAGRTTKTMSRILRATSKLIWPVVQRLFGRKVLERSQTHWPADVRCIAGAGFDLVMMGGV